VTTPLDPAAAKALAEVPVPTAKTLKRRKNVLLQLLRFAVINLRMIRVIRSSHHS